MARMVLPIKNETYEDHFIDNSWSTPQDQISAGYPYWIQPTNATAEFEDGIDYGATISEGVQINLIATVTHFVSGVTITPTISVSLDDVSYTDYSDVWSVFVSNFRYVKINISASDGGTGIVLIDNPKVTISLKTITDGGSGTAASADSGGTTVTPNKTFLDFTSITVTPAYQVGETKGITAVYDDTGAPDDFTVFLYSNNTGSRIDGDFYWQLRGY